MKAEVEPLRGKYYGTVIRIKDGPLAGKSFDVWFPDGEPSRREIESWGITQEQWDNNSEVDDGWGGKAPVRTLDYLCDCHYESKSTLTIAEAIVKALADVNLDVQE